MPDPRLQEKDCEVSRLTVIAHWECPNDPQHGVRHAAAPEGVERWRCYSCGVAAVYVEYVPAEQLRGAVSLDEFAQALLDVALTPDSDAGHRLAKAERLIAAKRGQ